MAEINKTNRELAKLLRIQLPNDKLVKNILNVLHKFWDSIGLFKKNTTAVG